MLTNFILITSEIDQWDFPKVAILKRSTKGAMTGFFRRVHQLRVSKNEMHKQFGVSADEAYL